MAKKTLTSGRSAKTSGKTPAHTIRHGGKAGKDTFTEVLDRVLGGLFGNKIMAIGVVVVLVGGAIAWALIHKSRVERSAQAARQLVGLRRADAKPTVEQIQKWLATYEGQPGELEVRLLLIRKYTDKALADSDATPLTAALEQIRRIREKFAGDPLVTAKIHLSPLVGPRGLLDQLESKLDNLKEQLSPAFRDAFRQPSKETSETSEKTGGKETAGEVGGAGETSASEPGS